MISLDTSIDLVQLGMYDWPEVRTATDRLWIRIHEALAKRGITSPEALERNQDHEVGWLSPRLLLSQTCGLPLVQDLRDQVAVLGRFTYQGLPMDGNYHSVIITRQSGLINHPSDLLGKRAAINHENSYSGCLALKRWVSSLGESPTFFSKVIETGSHRNSVRAVADDLVDTAAIDRVSWCLAKRIEPAAKTLKVIAKTDDRPGLPLITRTEQGTQSLSKLRSALNEASKMLDPVSRATLGITGFIAAEYQDYDVIHDDLQQFGNNSLS